MNPYYRSIAISHKYPNLRNGYDFELYNEDVSEGGELIFNWLTSKISKPSDSDLQKWFKEHEALQYQRDRAVAYPSIQDQLDKIYHSGIDEWKKDIKAVKDKYPKPK